jgi:ABC-type transport system involved in cytochrome c biogenesis permease subunit
MRFEPTAVTLLVCAAMAAYLSAAAAFLFRSRRAGLPNGPGAAAPEEWLVAVGHGWLLYGLGFALALAAFTVRWVQTTHVPMQNLYEVFVVMGMLMLPMSLFCRAALGVRGEAADALLGLVVLFPVAFVFNPDPQRLPPALQSPLFVPHVAVYMASYVILGKAGVQAVWHLAASAARGGTGRAADLERAAHRMVLFGFPLLTLGLVLGSWWARLAWDDFWGWDPKELWSLVSWLAFLGYLHFRGRYGGRYARVNSALVVAGCVFILITLLWANLARIFEGLHSYA